MKYRSSPKSNNTIGVILQMCGAMVVFFGIIVSVALASPKASSRSWYGNDEFNWGVAMGGFVISVAAGMGLFAIAEVLNLLQTSCDLEYTILLHLRGEEETEEGAGTDSTAAGAGPVPPVSAKTEPSGKGAFSAAPISAAARPAAARPGAASGGFVQFCPHCGAKQSSPAAKCWHCGGTLSGR